VSATAATSADELCAAARVAFDRARSAAGGDDVDLRIGHQPVRLSLAGPALKDTVERALASSDVGRSAVPALTIRAWDAVSTGVPLDIAPAVVDQTGRLGLVESLCDERHRVVLGSAVTIVDLNATEVIYHVPEPSRVAYWELAHPARVAFAAWAPSVGLRMCHGAAVGRREGGVLVVGSGGSGKSTIALTCLKAGLLCAGDDYVLVRGGPAPRAFGLYATTLLQHDHAEQHPALMDQPSLIEATREREPAGKALAFATPGGFAVDFPLTAVLVPRVTASEHPRLRRIGPAVALRALAPSTVLQLGSFDATALASLSALCRSLPCFELELGRDLAGVPMVVEEAIAAASRERR